MTVYLINGPESVGTSGSPSEVYYGGEYGLFG